MTLFLKENLFSHKIDVAEYCTQSSLKDTLIKEQSSWPQLTVLYTSIIFSPSLKKNEQRSKIVWIFIF